MSPAAGATAQVKMMTQNTLLQDAQTENWKQVIAQGLGHPLQGAVPGHHLHHQLMLRRRHCLHDVARRQCKCTDKKEVVLRHPAAPSSALHEPVAAARNNACTST